MKKKSPPLFVSQGEWSTLLVYPKRKERGVDITIPRSLFPRSTARNRLRRQIREAIRKTFPSLKGDRSVFIRVKKGEPSPPFKMIRREIERHLKQSESFV